MEYANSNPDDDFAPAKIKSFEKRLDDRNLVRIGKDWFAADDSEEIRFPEELEKPKSTYREGAASEIVINAYERDPRARRECLEAHGYRCAVCSFDFEQTYGPIGEGYIHVHHKIPLGEIQKEHTIDPVEDLIPVCPNCHAMIHATNPAQTVEQLRDILDENSTS